MGAARPRRARRPGYSSRLRHRGRRLRLRGRTTACCTSRSSTGWATGSARRMLAGLAVGAYRHARRAGASLAGDPRRHRRAPWPATTTTSRSPPASSARSTSAPAGSSGPAPGHPPPLLLRGRKVVAELDCARRRSRSGSAPARPAVSTCDLEPGDAVLLYTDGVTDAHPPRGDLFGLDRLADLLEREAAGEQQPEELLRRLVQRAARPPGGRPARRRHAAAAALDRRVSR